MAERLNDDTSLDLACPGGGEIDLSAVFVHEYRCESCDEMSLVDISIEELPDLCDKCGGQRRRVSDKPICLKDLL